MVSGGRFFDYDLVGVIQYKHPKGQWTNPLILFAETHGLAMGHIHPCPLIRTT